VPTGAGISFKIHQHMSPLSSFKLWSWCTFLLSVSTLSYDLIVFIVLNTMDN